MKLIQLTHAREIMELEDYSILHILENLENEESKSYQCSLLRVQNNTVQTEALTEIDFLKDRDRAVDVVKSLTGILGDAAVLADQHSLALLKRMYEEAGVEDGDASPLRFIPAEKFFSSVFPSLEASDAAEAGKLAGFFQIELPETEPALRWPYAAFQAFCVCCRELSDNRERPEDNTDEEASRKEETKEKQPKKLRYSDKQLRRAAKKIWAVSPWTVLAVFVFLFIAAAVLIPKETTSPTDRTKAPVNYLVLSWDKPGKYGARSRLTGSIEFRIPYGVYNVLNNNSIPVEITVADEGTVLIAQSSKETEEEAQPLSATADNLSVGSDGTEEKEEKKQRVTEITIRPNTSREIILDEEQYLTLSEDANELIFFYLHEVPDEIDDGTTGQVNQTQAIVYAYVKGTDVRFRSAPSLEGHVINTLNNGQQVQVLGVTGEWTHVKVQDQNGYIFSQYVSSEDTSVPQTEVPEE